MAIHHIPRHFHSVTPYITVKDAEKLLQFVFNTFLTKELHRSRRGDGKLANVQILIEGSMVEINEANPPHIPALTAALHIYVPDVDDTYKKALSAGATSIFPPENMFWGAREAGVEDESGTRWYLGTQIEEVTAEDLKKRIKEADEH